MIELVGTCIRCNKNVYCTDGFLNGITLGGGRILCFSCKEHDPLVEILNRLLIIEPNLDEKIVQEGGEVKSIPKESIINKENYQWVLEELEKAITFGMDSSTREHLIELKNRYNNLVDNLG
ncbi:hypothetical protein [Robertmurraya sp. Marseille-Q9965]